MANIILVEGDLLAQHVEVIVNAWNRNIIPWWLLLPQGVSGAIKKQKLKPILLDLNIYDKPNLRNTLEGILFRLRNGCTWRDIPEAFGCHNTIFKTFRRWSKSHKFIQLFHNMVKQPDLE